ncbi:MAG: DUF4145 domain-containing protein [Candidatus Marinimicrobia bacterium]|nr:DUF4145 domain-containing protein [Candidatus Neomarinimicrobiota bacterium]
MLYQIGATRKLFCNTCKTETNHTLTAISDRVQHDFDNSDIAHRSPIWTEIYQYRFWVCNGCDSALLEEATSDDACIDQDGEQLFASKYFPRPLTTELPEIRYSSLTDPLRKIYKEVIGCFNNNFLIACAISMRALIEGVCLQHYITDADAWNLSDKLKKLGQEKNLREDVVNVLLDLKFMGDDGAHRLVIPDKQELLLAIRIVEELLNVLYEIDFKLTYKTKHYQSYRSKKAKD